MSGAGRTRSSPGGAFPAELRRILGEHHAGGIQPSECRTCSAPCCLQSGFALLPNVKLIYQRYCSGRLRRHGFRFSPGLDFAGFVAAYFDVSQRPARGGQPLVLFHPRSLGPTGQPIAVPLLGDYFETRAALFDANLWLNRGCLFLSRSRPPWPDEDGLPRRCIVHDDARSNDSLGSKPIDCVFLTCDRRGHIREPSIRLSERWFAALARALPGARTSS